MKISYLITCSIETETLSNLFLTLSDYFNDNEDEVIIITDENSTNNDITKKIISSFGSFDHRFDIGIDRIRSYLHPLNSDYGAHKNWGTKQCRGDYIFQIDGDELPSKNILGENLHSIIESNPDVELIYVPRINDYKGVTEEHARQWGWRLTPSPGYNNRPLVNWPDYQSRIYRNIPDRIKWDRKLHEKIVGHNQYSFLPDEEEYAIYHDKTIEKQIETNLRYNKVFTVEDNMGHKVI
jgi:glycosyltransferase involved in cell wall biosynthesis